MTDPIDTAQPEALRLAAWLNEGCWHQMRLGDVEAAGRELRSQHASIAALEAKLAAAEGDTLRLDFMCSQPPRMVDRERDAEWWRVYEDKAPPEAPVADWKAIVTHHQRSPRAAIDAAMKGAPHG